MNMSYCRFENTASDLQDVLNYWDDDLSNNEEKAREKIIELARKICELE
jgi:hypothetical protein